MANKPDNKAQAITKLEAPRVADLSLDIAHRVQSTAVAVLQDARTELRSAIDGTIDLAEKVATGGVRFARKLVQRVDEASSDALKGTERALTETIEVARETARLGRERAEKLIEKVSSSAA